MIRMGVILVIVFVLGSYGSYASPSSLDMTIYRDGLVHVLVVFDVDPLEPTFPLELFGPSVDNFVATDNEGRLLSSDIAHGMVLLDTFESDVVMVNYDTHDLVSKEGRVWTFSLNAPLNYTLLMPNDAVIVGMDAVPHSFALADQKAYLEMPPGVANINYILSSVGPAPIQTAPVEQENDNIYLMLVGIPAVTAAAGIILALRNRSRQPQTAVTTIEPPMEAKPNTEDIFSRIPNIRKEDMSIVRYIVENGGERLESELRKEFLQPRTTMWRAVKRLERMGIVIVEKKGAQNMVKIRHDLESQE